MLTTAIGVINKNSDQLTSLVADADYNQTFTDSAKNSNTVSDTELDTSISKEFYFRGAKHAFDENDPIYFMAAKNPQHR